MPPHAEQLSGFKRSPAGDLTTRGAASDCACSDGVRASCTRLTGSVACAAATHITAYISRGAD